MQIYAFLDPGNSDKFCTEALMEKLNLLEGRLLRTMKEEKSVSTYMVSGLGVRCLSGDEFIDLLHVFRC